jgi:cytochrome c556
MKTIGIGMALIAAMSVCAMGASAATAPSGATAAKYRILKMKDLGGEYKSLTDELKKRRPNADIVAASAKGLMEMSAQLNSWFPKGSGPETRVKMRAKPNIWTSGAEFSTIARNTAAESVKLNAMVQRNDLAAAEAQARVVGEGCKACHDKFRTEDE